MAIYELVEEGNWCASSSDFCLDLLEPVMTQLGVGCDLFDLI